MQELERDNVAVCSGENTGQDYCRSIKEGCWQMIKEETSWLWFDKNWRQAGMQYVWILVFDHNGLGNEKNSWKWWEWHKMVVYIQTWWFGFCRWHSSNFLYQTADSGLNNKAGGRSQMIQAQGQYRKD